MAKKNTAVAKRGTVEVISKGWFDVELPGGKKGIGISAELKDKIYQTASGIGSLIRTFEEKQTELTAFSLTVNEVFTKYKDVTKNGLPAFVRDLIDPTCPGSYGKVGTKDRDDINKHAIFRGVEALIKRANKAKAIEATRKALKDAGINPDAADKVTEHNKQARQDKKDKDIAEFVNCMIGFAKYGVTESTLTRMLAYEGKADEKSDLTDSGTEYFEAAQKALLKKGLMKAETESATA